MEKIDIGIYSFGRLFFLQQCIQSIISRTNVPYNLFVANNFNSHEPEIENYLIELYNKKIIQGLILIKENVFSSAINLLYRHFLKSDFFVVTEGDVVLPNVNYCWLEYMIRVLKSDPKMAYLTIRSSLNNLKGKDREEKTPGYSNYVLHPYFNNIGLNHFTGVSFQVFKRSFYKRYIRHEKGFKWDHMIWRYATKRDYKFGSLLDDCMNLGYQTLEYYPYFVELLNKDKKSDRFEPYRRCYGGFKYVIYEGGNPPLKRKN